MSVESVGSIKTNSGGPAERTGIYLSMHRCLTLRLSDQCVNMLEIIKETISIFYILSRIKLTNYQSIMLIKLSYCYCNYNVS